MDLNKIDERFNKYFEGIKAAKSNLNEYIPISQKEEIAAIKEEEEPMKRTGNLDGLDLELS